MELQVLTIHAFVQKHKDKGIATDFLIRKNLHLFQTQAIAGRVPLLFDNADNVLIAQNLEGGKPGRKPSKNLK